MATASEARGIAANSISQLATTATPPPSAIRHCVRVSPRSVPSAKGASASAANTHRQNTIRAGDRPVPSANHPTVPDAPIATAIWTIPIRRVFHVSPMARGY